MQILISFILKAVDNGLSTAKTIYINKEKYFIASLLNGMATFFYLVAIVQLTKTNSIANIIAMCVATFIGTLLPGIMVRKSERDKLYIFDITSDSLESGKKFADEVRKHNVAIKTYKSYDNNMNKILSCKVYCTTKEETKIVNSLIQPNFKYNIYVPLKQQE